MPAGTTDPDETTAVRHKRGEELLATMSDGRPPAVLDDIERDFPFLSHAIHTYAGGEVLAREVLDPRTRQLALVAAFAALGLDEFVKLHAGYGLNVGATEEELKEIVYLTTIPGGFARAVQASQAVAKALASHRSG